MFAVLSASTHHEARDASEVSTFALGAEVVDAVLELVRSHTGLIGVGIAPDAGQATSAALSAVRSTRQHSDKAIIDVAASVPSDLVYAAQALLRLVARLVWERTEAQWRVVDAMRDGSHGRQQEAAAALGVSVQAISHALRRAGWRDELAGRKSAAALLRMADETVAQW